MLHTGDLDKNHQCPTEHPDEPEAVDTEDIIFVETILSNEFLRRDVNSINGMMSPGGDSKDHLANYIIRDREFEVGDSVLVPPDPINKTESCELDSFMVSDRISVYNPRIPPAVQDSLLNHNSVVFTGDEEFKDTDYVPTGVSNLIKIHDRDALFDLSNTTGGQLIPQRTLPGSMDQTYNVEPRKTVQHVLHVTEGIEPRASYSYHLPDKAEVVKQTMEIYSHAKSG